MWPQGFIYEKGKRQKLTVHLSLFEERPGTLVVTQAYHPICPYMQLRESENSSKGKKIL
jgi:hypothetical protein